MPEQTITVADGSLFTTGPPYNQIIIGQDRYVIVRVKGNELTIRQITNKPVGSPASRQEPPAMTEPTTSAAVESTIPADWDITDPHTWTLSQTVNAHMGYHETGMIERRYETITESATDLDHTGDIAESIAQGQDQTDIAEWWADVLSGFMAGRIAQAEASPEEMERAAVILDAPDWIELGYLDADDLEQEAANGRKIAAALEQAHAELST